MIMKNHPRGRGRVGALMWAVVWCIVIIVHNTHAETMDDCLKRVTACRTDRSIYRKRACGSDGHTYPSKCALIQAQCNRVAVTFVSDGPCSETKPCQESYRYAQILKKAGLSGVFVPRCRYDGRYASVQCDAPDSGGGRCWCVTDQGLPVPGTAVHKKRPRCSRNYRSKSTIRRYSRGGVGRKNRPGCNRPDRQLFNSNIMRIFRSEWYRDSTPNFTKQRSDAEIDRIVLDWKFMRLDIDSNDILNTSEYIGLNKIVRKVIKPKKCAKLFPKNCDINHNHRITRQEWVECLAKDGMDDDRNSRSWNDDGVTSVAGEEDQDEEDENDTDEDDQINQMMKRKMMEDLQTSAPPSTPPNFSDESNEAQTEGDCMMDRKAVLNEQQSNNLYVPECTSDGRYKKVQCYSDYCWCVNEDTGKNIPGTSLKDAMPKCELLVIPSRPMKGCPENRKTQFLRDLVDFFQSKMSSGSESDRGNATNNGWQASREEKIVTWSFVYLDKNKNKILERKEWKTFRTLVSSNQNLRHCGKKLPRYCDVNKDRKISITEWLNCLGVNTKVKSSSVRTGPNPLEHILKSD